MGVCCKEFATFYHKVVNVEESPFKRILQTVHTKTNENITTTALNFIMNEGQIKETFPDIEIAARILLIIMITYCRGHDSRIEKNSE